MAFRPGPRQGVDATVLAAIRDAVLRRRLLGMTYTDGAGRRRERVVEPCGIVHGQRAFLLAALPDKPHAVLWRLDRMAAVMVRREGFRPRFDLRHEMADCFGVGRDAAEVAFCSPFGPTGYGKPKVWIEAPDRPAEGPLTTRAVSLVSR